MELSLGLLSRFVSQLHDRTQLAKLTLCLQVAFSSLFRFIYAAQAVSLQAVLVSFAVLILACDDYVGFYGDVVSAGDFYAFFDRC